MNLLKEKFLDVVWDSNVLLDCCLETGVSLFQFVCRVSIVENGQQKVLNKLSVAVVIAFPQDSADVPLVAKTVCIVSA